MICPYCDQGIILKARVKHTGTEILICEECDTVWLDEVSDKSGTSLSEFMKSQSVNPFWSELEITDQNSDMS
ncbi:MAG: hypothetical protein J1E40_08890 [Oscillospiraceae bacterium]|nr:hypothetical protein [Oscillospiraceae bacterium]